MGDWRVECLAGIWFPVFTPGITGYLTNAEAHVICEGRNGAT